jgi:ABC-type dipeptide/oligopeptide/nickel transport system permease component
LFAYEDRQTTQTVSSLITSFFRLVLVMVLFPTFLCLTFVYTFFFHYYNISFCTILNLRWMEQAEFLINMHRLQRRSTWFETYFKYSRNSIFRKLLGYEDRQTTHTVSSLITSFFRLVLVLVLFYTFLCPLLYRKIL